jgi:hypothetical protein
MERQAVEELARSSRMEESWGMGEIRKLGKAEKLKS